jgi:hypothetical protein
MPRHIFRAYSVTALALSSRILPLAAMIIADAYAARRHPRYRRPYAGSDHSPQRRYRNPHQLREFLEAVDARDAAALLIGRRRHWNHHRRGKKHQF